MLRVTQGSDNIEVRFDHRLCKSHEIESFIGVFVEGERRCSLVVVSSNGEEVGRGIAICHPVDNFCRAIGRKKALAYALFPLAKEARKAVWKEYEIQCGF